MTLLDAPLERRLGGIETRLSSLEASMQAVQTDLAVIKKQLEAVPTRWMQWLFALAILMPLYGILVTLLLQTLKAG